MKIKNLIAVSAVLVGIAGAVPTAASAAVTKQCPPGVTNATYCAFGNSSGLQLFQLLAVTSNPATVNVRVRCSQRTTCTGTFYLEGAHNTIYGSAPYSIGAGQFATLAVTTTSAGQATLNAQHLLLTTGSAVVSGVRSTVGVLLILNLHFSLPF